MHIYDVPRRQSFQPVRAARPVQAPSGGPSATPIYDALYAEYVKSYRALPGDRSGEEELRFIAFGNSARGSDRQDSGSYGPSSYRAYSAGASLTRHSGGVQSAPPQSPSPSQPPSQSPSQPQWQRVGTLTPQHGTGTYHVPAALPPARRSGL